jgi:hypothetical protein
VARGVLIWLHAATDGKLTSETVSHARVVNYALRTGSVAIVFASSAAVAALGWPRTAQYLWTVVVIALVLLRFPAVRRGWHHTEGAGTADPTPVSRVSP